MKPPPGTPLCALSDIANPGAKGFTFGAGADRFEMFVVRSASGVFGYVNSCPHQGATLETFADQFLTFDKELILCSLHGAQFQIDDGFCVLGPCLNKRLTPVAITLEDGAIALA